MNSITVCVEYDDYLAITLPENVRHFDKTLVVTAPGDQGTLDVVQAARELSGAAIDVLVTDAFYEAGAPFWKAKAMEEAFSLMDVMDGGGWLCVWDADVLMPGSMDLEGIEIGYLYSPHRRICEEPGEGVWFDFRRYPQGPEVLTGEYGGYFFLFHVDDPMLAKRPWYGLEWNHAGGCDTVFAERWPASRRRRLPFEVLHLGPVGLNWTGRWTRRLDGSLPRNYQKRKRWRDLLTQQLREWLEVQ